ncbi:MAG: hypothetical protein IT426_20100 [Pirellulales bacterium]|nr:hypothetical protein [Pirellulales bacterium]
MYASVSFRGRSNLRPFWIRGSLPVLLGALIAAGGCGPKIPELIPVEGRVTFKGGAWPKAGLIDFTCHEPAPGFPGRSGVGEFGVDGNFKVKTGEHVGLMPGTYRITVSCWEKPPGENFKGLSHLPEKFTTADKSGLELKIEPGHSGTVTWNHDFPSRQ